MGRRWKPLARQAIEYILVEVLELIATRGSRGNGMERETRLRTRDIQLGRDVLRVEFRFGLGRGLSA